MLKVACPYRILTRRGILRLGPILDSPGPRRSVNFAMTDPQTPPFRQAAETKTVQQRPCPQCGGHLQWSPRAQALQCPYCGTEVALEDALPTPDASAATAAQVQELDLMAMLSDPRIRRGWGEQQREVQCQSCKAISVFDAKRVAQRCDFCGSPAIVAHESHEDAITPQSVLPFQLTQAQVHENVRRWYGTLWLAPSRLRKAALTDTLRGVYLPYWTFDAHAHAQWRADAGYYYYVTETYTDSKGETRTREVRHTRWEHASGEVRHFFDDLLVPGTMGIHEKLLRDIEPFPTRTDLRPYVPEFVRGWTVERYQLDLPKAARQGQEKMDEELRRLCVRQIPGDTYRDLSVRSQYSDRTFKHVLVPVWLVSYRYGSKTYQVVANGYTGKMAGEYPYSPWKIALLVLAALLILALIIWAEMETG